MSARLAIVPSAVPPETCSTWLEAIDAVYHRNEVAPNPEFVPESSSFRLAAVDGLSVADVWSAVSPLVREQCVVCLEPRLAIDVDQCWVRRQYAPAVSPPRHRPHTWHQDGALGFRFGCDSVGPFAIDALLRMATCWIALTPCGVDAPALELLTDRLDHMLSPAQLADRDVDQRWPAARRTRPSLKSGDALVFTGDVLHRTHVTTAMTRARTSIELRLFAADAIPDRVIDDEFVPA